MIVRTALFWEGAITFNDGFNGNTLEDDDKMFLSGGREGRSTDHDEY